MIFRFERLTVERWTGAKLVTISWDVTLWSLVDLYCFGGICCLHPQGGRVRILLFPEDGDKRFLQNVGNYLPDYMVLHPRRGRSNKRESLTIFFLALCKTQFEGLGFRTCW
jgi:hypothetical protein